MPKYRCILIRNPDSSNEERVEYPIITDGDIPMADTLWVMLISAINECGGISWRGKAKHY